MAADLDGSVSSGRSHTAEITRPATLEHLPALLAYLDRAATEAGLGDEVLFPLHLAVEEACANVILHGYPTEPGPLTLRVEAAPSLVAVILTDEAPPFDPDHVPPPPLDGDAESRPIGGLGWHLIREVMDEVRHESISGGNRLTLIKRYPPPDSLTS